MNDFSWAPWLSRRKHPNQDLFDLLEKLPLFDTFNPKELHKFMQLIYRRQYTSGETIFKEREPGVGMYIILTGAVRIILPSESEDIQLAYLGPGHFFGELALFSEGPRSATAVADEDTELAGIYRPDFIEYSQQNPLIGNRLLFHLANIICEKLRRTNREYRLIKYQVQKQNPAAA